MTIKTILTVVGVEGGDGDLKIANDLCQEIGAHLSVLVMGLASPPPIGAYAATISDAWLQERQADLKGLQERTSAVSAFIASNSVTGDVASEYAEIVSADDMVGRRGRYVDLTVVGPSLLSGATLKDKVIEGALFWSTRPLLIVPDGCRATLRPKRVMVAWDSTVEASRAVRESLEVLAAASEVHLTLVDPVEGELAHGAEPGADAAAYLARHGVKVTVDRLPGQNHSVADVLRRHATDTGAELLVMGAYGHSRLRQRLFGGVTRSMLEEPGLPVLMAR